jgi:acyl-CoA thioester hydrolase
MNPGSFFEHRLLVRYGETDQMGVVHHGTYVLYMEEGRTRMMRNLGCPYGELERDGFALVVRKLELRYRAPAYYEDELSVRTSVAELRTSAIVFAYEIRRAKDEQLLVEGSTELVCVDRSAGKPRPRSLPQKLCDVLRPG